MRISIQVSSGLPACAVAGALGMWLICIPAGALADATPLNVSYDVARELPNEINAAFVTEWKAKTGETVTGGGRGATTTFTHTAYLEFLFSPPARETIVKHGFRPPDEKVLEKHAARFPAIETINVEQTLASWAEAEKKHLAEGGIHDQIAVKR